MKRLSSLVIILFLFLGSALCAVGFLIAVFWSFSLAALFILWGVAALLVGLGIGLLTTMPPRGGTIPPYAPKDDELLISLDDDREE